MKKLLLAAGIAALIAGPASAATVTITSTAGYNNSLPALVTFEDGPALFHADDLALGFKWDGADQGIVVAPPTTANHAVPFGDTSKFYFSIPGGDSQELDLNHGLLGPIHDIRFFIGSLDTYNHLKFCDGGLGGTCIDLTGTQLLNSVPTPIGDSGDQGNALTNREFNFQFGPKFNLDTVVFSSDQDAFEVDNFNVSGAVPEPGTWAFLIVGFGALGWLIRRHKAAPVTA